MGRGDAVLQERVQRGSGTPGPFSSTDLSTYVPSVSLPGLLE